MRIRWFPLMALLFSGLILGLFQNCTSAVPFGDTNYYKSVVTSDIFPYEMGFDQLAYLSCSEQEDVAGDGDGTFFTFRMGSYRDMGIRITDEFRDSIEKLTDENIISALQENLSSSGLRLQFAIRTLDNLQSMYVNGDNGAEGLEGSDFQTFFSQMGDGDLSRLLWFMEPEQYLRNYVSGRTAIEYRFEGQVKFMATQSMERHLRSFFGNRGIIALTFTKYGEVYPLGPGSLLELQGHPPDERAIRDPINNIYQNVFGMAVQPRFKQPTPSDGGSPGPDMPPRVMASVTEYIIDNRKEVSDIRPWECPNDMQFMIVLPEYASYQPLDDEGNPVGGKITRCAMEPDPISPDNRLQIIRQSLPSEDWYVDMERKCVVPKEGFVVEGTCYGINSHLQKTHKINYDTFSEGCGFQLEKKGLCPHYASICFRQ